MTQQWSTAGKQSAPARGRYVTLLRLTNSLTRNAGNERVVTLCRQPRRARREDVGHVGLQQDSCVENYV